MTLKEREFSASLRGATGLTIAGLLTGAAQLPRKSALHIKATSERYLGFMLPPFFSMIHRESVPVVETLSRCIISIRGRSPKN
jgi:hypothetical protein